ncbi:MAG: tRNA pseudouridine(55) synthase TruB [Candidatus Gastranaerophilaceae bacterium]
MFGFLNVYKPVGMTSHDVVAFLRRVLKIKQIGHTGTLDPFAEGVLPISIGKATRLIEYLREDKGYIATVQFGISTDTYDSEGKITFESDIKVTSKDIDSILAKFCGEIEQIPPIYSAIKVKGKKLYEYARSGEKVEIKPRKVIIDKIELIDFNYEKQQATINIECSKGTYIRSIASDIGKELGCGAHLIKLIRTKSGHFVLENTINLESLENLSIIQDNLINPIDVLPFDCYQLTEEEHKKVKNGQSFVNKSIKNADFVILVYNNVVSAVANCTNYVIKVCKVFEI